MKVLFVTFIFCVHYVTSEEGKHPVISFPKKVPGQILINYGKYANKQIPIKLVTKAEGKDTKYTFFQKINEPQNTQIVPESPYFSADPVIVQKPRVKKVLPDYVWSSLVRSKRSAETPSPKSDNITSTTTTATHTRSIVSKSLDEAKVSLSQHNETRRTITEDAHKSAAVKAKTVESNIVNKIQSKPAGRSVKRVLLNNKKKSRNNPRKRKGTKIAGKVPAKKSRIQSGNKGKAAQKKAKKLTKTNKSRILAKSKTRFKGKPIVKKGTTVKKAKLRVRQRKPNPKQRQKPKNSSLSNNKWKKKGIMKGNVVKNKMPAETRRLIAARQASIEDYPYVVSIQKGDEHWCSGALLNPRLVITTANCVWKSKHISRMEIRAGSSFTDRGGQVAGIQEVMKHPRWGLRKKPDNDVALLLLDRIIKFSDTCHAVDLPNRAMFPAFDDAWVVSWGSERRDGVFDVAENNLQVYHSQVISHELCNNITTRFGVIVTDNFICLSQSGRTSPCTRDTGAPAVSDGILWGIASWGLRKLCGTERYPSMFSYIASQSNIDFIINATSHLMSDSRLHPFPDRHL